MSLSNQNTSTRSGGSSQNSSQGPNLGWTAFKTGLWSLESGVSLAVFRFVFGLIMLLEAYSLLRPSESSAGKVMLDVYYTGANIAMHFPYPGFSWLHMATLYWSLDAKWFQKKLSKPTVPLQGCRS